MRRQSPDGSQTQSLSHPYDTAIAVRELCRTHAELRRMRFRHKGNIPSLTATPEGSPILDTLNTLEGEIARLMALLPDAHKTGLASSIARTHTPALGALMPQTDSPTPFTADAPSVLFAIAMGVDALRFELDLGMKPSLSNFDNVFFPLMEKCAQPEANDWRQETARLLRREMSSLCTTLLGYIRERKAREETISPILSVFLADLLREHVRRHPENAQNACRGATIGSSTFDVAALILAGVPVPVDSHARNQGGPKVKALLAACASQHGRLAFIAEFGPLDRYFSKGQAPDYRSAVSET